MEKFWKALETELRAQRITVNGSFVGNIYKLARTEVYFFDFYRRPCMQGGSRYLEIYPAKGVAHNIDVAEIWVGRDSEGYPWSDNMGGRRIDCTGKTMKTAAQELVKALLEHFPEYFKRGA